MIDVGSGFGTPALFFGLGNSEIQITGFDIAPEKIKHATERAKFFRLKNVGFKLQDLSEAQFELPLADYYYFFAPVHPNVATKLMADLEHKAKSHSFRLITYLGMTLNKTMSSYELPWLRLQWQDDGIEIFETVPRD